MTGWNFGTLQSGWKGHGNAAQGHFRDARYQSLAREVIQNSLDVIADPSSVMTVEFKCFTRNVSDIPDSEELREVLKKCKQEAKTKGKKKKAYKFYKNAVDLFDSEQLSILEISESNTEGMPGPNEPGMPFYAYMQAEGEGEKDEDAGGSHGVGKAAKLVVSDIRTLFVSTKYEDRTRGGRIVNLCQGKARLQSFYADDGRVSDSDGFWGPDDSFDPVDDEILIPEWMRRKSIGTSFFILGFSRISDWQNRLIASVVENFFVAILEGKLRVRVGETMVDSSTIATLAESSELEKSVADTSNQPENFQNTRHFIRAYAGLDKIEDNTQQVDPLGNCRVRLSIHPGAPNRVCLVRRGMLITTSLDGLKRFQNMKDFAALIECQTKKGNQFIRSLENIKHDKISPEELDEAKAQKKAATSIKRLSKSVKDILLKHAAIESQGAGDISFVSGLFSDESSADDSFKSNENNPSGEIKWSPRPIKPKVNKSPVFGTDPIIDPPPVPPDPIPPIPPIPPVPVPPTPVGQQVVALNDVRVIKTAPNRLKVFFSTDQHITLFLSVYSAGAEEDERLSIQKLSGPGRVLDGKARITSSKSQRHAIELTLSSVPRSAFKVIAELIK